MVLTVRSTIGLDLSLSELMGPMGAVQRIAVRGAGWVIRVMHNVCWHRTGPLA